MKRIIPWALFSIAFVSSLCYGVAPVNKVASSPSSASGDAAAIATLQKQIQMVSSSIPAQIQKAQSVTQHALVQLQQNTQQQLTTLQKQIQQVQVQFVKEIHALQVEMHQLELMH